MSVHGSSQGRLRAVLLCALPWLLGGCASSGATPLGASLAAIWPGQTETTRRASELPYASLDARLGDIQGLLVMGAQAGSLSYWPARQGVVLELWQGGLHGLRGTETELLGTSYSSGPPWRHDSPHAFTMIRHLSTTTGNILQMKAEGRMRCENLEPMELPLGERTLERCDLELTWTGGETTNSTLWRAPHSRALWAMEDTPWPDGPAVEWRVARHWW